MWRQLTAGVAVDAGRVDVEITCNVRAEPFLRISHRLLSPPCGKSVVSAESSYLPLHRAPHDGLTTGEGTAQIEEKTNSEIELRSRGFNSLSRKLSGSVA